MKNRPKEKQFQSSKQKTLELKSMKKRKIAFQSSDGLRLVGILEDPPETDGMTQSPDVVLFLHGLSTQKCEFLERVRIQFRWR